MEAARAPRPSRREQLRTYAAIGLVAISALFAVLNLDQVDVNWLFGTWETPLIVVIAVSLILGAGIGWTLARRRSSA